MDGFKKSMEITWLGHSCFRMTERGLGSVVCDPYDSQTAGFEPLKLKGDIVTVSCNEPGHNFVSAVKSDYFLMDRPGEYEVNNIFVNGYPSKDLDGRKNTIFTIEFNGLFIAHLGTLDHVLSQTEIEALGTVNVLLIPVGGGDALNAAKAVELISNIQPNIVIPMHYGVSMEKQPLDPLSKFLKEMGIVEPDNIFTTFKITNSTQLPEETKVVILNHPLESEIEKLSESDHMDSSSTGSLKESADSEKMPEFIDFNLDDKDSDDSEKSRNSEKDDNEG